MNSFENRLREAFPDGLSCKGIEILQVNVGRLCNLACRHCHLACGPDRTEIMPAETMAAVADLAGELPDVLVDVTGGEPCMHPEFEGFIQALALTGRAVQVRTNLTSLVEPGGERTLALLRECGVRLVGSMPCYLEANVAAQRGEGVYPKAVEALRRLNAAGYGVEGGLELDLVYNPGGPVLPPDQGALETAYRKELGERFGVRFSHLLAIANMPIGRFAESLRERGENQAYERLLQESFNPQTAANLMCRKQICVDWDGRLYDCDFNLALGLTANHGAPDRLEAFDEAALAHRRIVTGEHCFGCTAGAGSSCGGTLT